MVMVGDNKAGLKARLRLYRNRLKMYRKGQGPARGVSRNRLGVYQGEVDAPMRGAA